MSGDYIQLPADGVGKKVDTAQIVDGPDTVQRQIIVIGDPTDPTGVISTPSVIPTTGQVPYLPVRALPQQRSRTTFSKVLSGVDTSFFTLLVTGSGQSVNQSGGNLVITSGTTANSETILRSLTTVTDPFTFRYFLLLSQRIINQNFIFELVDLIGDALTLTVNSATSITVGFPAGTNPFTAQNIGQGVSVGNISGVAAAIPGRYVIASIPTADSVSFTVAGWPASGSGTCSLFGWNNHQIIYNGTVATNCTYDAQRNGWASGATTATINTTATGHVGIVNSEDNIAAFLDQLVASSTLTQTQPRASRVQNVPGQQTNLYLQIRCLNGSTAPASTTTMTVGFVSMENYSPQQMSVTSIRPQPLNAGAPVIIAGGANSQSAQVSVGGIARGTSNNGGNPLYVATGLSTNPAAITTGRMVDLWADIQGRLLVQLGGPLQLQNLDRITLTTTTETTLIAAIASVRKGLHNLIIANRDNVAHTVDIKDSTAGTTRFSIIVPAGVSQPFEFPQGVWPAGLNTNWTATLRETATTAVEISAQSYTIAQ